MEKPLATSDNPAEASTAASEPSYYVDFSKIYFSWFSRERTSFMPIRHRIAIQNLRKAKNADELTLTLVYAEHPLDPPEHEKLVNFCVLHQIKLIEVHSLEAACSDCPIESQLFQNLLQELSDPNGNLGAASDICRILSGTFIQGNTYVDCDDIKNLDPQMLKKHVISVPHPCAQPGDLLCNLQEVAELTKVHYVSSNIIAFMCRTDIPVNQQMIRSSFSSLQKEVVHAYNNPNHLFSESSAETHSYIKLFLSESERRQKGKQDISFKTVFDLREFFENHLSLDHYLGADKCNLDERKDVHPELHNAVWAMYQIARRLNQSNFEELMRFHLDRYKYYTKHQLRENLLPEAKAMFLVMIEKFLKISVCSFSGPVPITNYLRGTDFSLSHSLQYYSLANAFHSHPARCSVRTPKAQIEATATNDLSWVPSRAAALAADEQLTIRCNVLFRYHALATYKEIRSPTPEPRMAAESDPKKETASHTIPLKP
ncbi:MAG: glycosyltransferase family 88 protein [Pseudomonadota bacterium]